MRYSSLILLSIYIPALIFALQVLAEIFLPQSTLEVAHSEWGPHETAQAILTALSMVIAAVSAIQIFSAHHISNKAYLGSYFLFAALCCLYVTGEEISWGQHIFDWTTPDYWHAINDQGETNLHNASSLFDQKPRLVLLIGIASGGLILPLLRLFKINPVPANLRLIIPHGALSVCAFFTVLMSILDKIDERLEGVVLFERASEVQELFMFLFVFLYLLLLRQKLEIRAPKDH